MKLFRQAREIARLRAEAAEVDRATLALHDSYKRQHERAQKRIDALTRERDTLRDQYGHAERKNAALTLAATNQAAHIGMLRAERDKATAEVKRIDGQLVQAGTKNLQLQAHVDMCERADLIAQETAWKRSADV